MSLKLSVGDEGPVVGAAKKEHMDEVADALTVARGKLAALVQQQQMQQDKEARFREAVDATNSRIVWWSLAQTAVVIIAAVWQVLHLRTYFKKKKLL